MLQNNNFNVNTIYYISGMNQMRRLSQKQLPSLKSGRQSNQLTQKTTQKNVKEIQQKISHHQAEIIRNQKTIVSLTNQFKILKQQLIRQQDINNKHQQAIQKQQLELEAFAKKYQQTKNIIKLLQRKLQQSQERLQNEKIKLKEYEDLNKEKSQNNIFELKKLLNNKTQENYLLQKTISQLQSQINSSEQQNKQIKMRQQIGRLNKQNDKLSNQIKNCVERQKIACGKLKDTMEIQENTKNQLVECQKKYQLIFKQYQNAKNKWKILLDEIKKSQNAAQQEVKRYKSACQEHTNCDSKYSQLKKTNEALYDKTKQLQGKILRFQQTDKKLHDQMRFIEFQSKHLTEKTQMQINQIKYKLDKQKKNNENYQKKIERLKDQLEKALSFESKVKNLKTLTENMSNKSKKIKQCIVCDLCKKILINPVTNIPCGHSYCIECKKGYQKECKKCINSGNTIRRQAVYRNELMDQIIQAYHLLVQTLKTIQ